MKEEQQLDLVSVIIPAYNIEKYIKKCIDCVRGQTYQNLEIILVDDGSTDRTPKICDLSASEDERIRVLHQPNGGLSRARNVGIDTSSGEYIFFVDGDDMVHIDCIRTLLMIMKKEDCDIVQCKTYSFLSEDKIPVDMPEEQHAIFTGKEMCECLLFGRYGSDTTVVWDKLYKKSFFSNLRFREGMLYEDVAIMHEIFWNAKKVVVTNLPLSFYRSKRQGSITHSANEKSGDQVRADYIQLTFFQKHDNPRFVGQCYYVLSNDMAKLRIYKDDLDGKIKENHKKIIREANREEMTLSKKFLINFGYLCPWGWFQTWKARRIIKEKIEWRKKGEKI